MNFKSLVKKAGDPNIESLCAILRQRGVAQFIALTATVGNPEELAYWLNCELKQSSIRDTVLNQEIWYQGKGHQVPFGQEEGIDIVGELPTSQADVVDYLLQSGRGPVLVFTESRKEASGFANAYSQRRVLTTHGLEMSEQLELFSEPTESSSQLRANAEKNVAFHTADLSPQQRQVVEKGFTESKFEVCYATPTLAAGVNFPFRSVVFPKLTYQWIKSGAQISISDYRNMSGRAGRFGMHPDGYAVLLPRNAVELEHAKKLVSPENERVSSQLAKMSMRRTVLMLIASGIVDQRSALYTFFENTYYWHQVCERNPDKLDEIVDAAKQSIEWLLESELIEQQGNFLLPTPLGKAASGTGLSPSTVIEFVELIKKNSEELEDKFEELVVGIIHWVCSSDEYLGDSPTRFFGYPSGTSTSSTAFLAGKTLIHHLDRTNDQLNQCVHALALYIDGLAERKISFQSKVSSGQLHRLAIDVAWILDGLHRISCVQDVACTQSLSNKFSMLSRRVKWGAPAEVLDAIRVAEYHKVPGFGRQRAMALFEQGLSTFEGILNTAKETLVAILDNEHRAVSFLSAISQTIGYGQNRLANSHVEAAKELGIEEMVKDCNTKLGTEYEDAIARLLKVETSWSVTILDDGKRQNVPDLLLTLGELEVLIECKTCTKVPSFIKKEEASAVLQKGLDFDPRMKRVTLGKPAFDEHSKLKTMSASDLTLSEHHVFMEGLMRVHTGTVSPREYLEWLSTPGVTELDRLTGKATYLVE